MPFTEENKPLLEAAAAIDFKLKKNGVINPLRHNSYERGLFFIKKSIELHENNYGYSKVVYIRSRDKVTITCRHHGDFEITPSHHLEGIGCRKCSISLRSSNTEDFIRKANNVHNFRYDYSRVDYVNNSTKVLICCSIHGEFAQTPNNHLEGKACPKCGGSVKRTTEDFIKEATAIHATSYDYSLVDYSNTDVKVPILCKVPGHGVFNQTPYHHLQGHGCPRCGGHNHNILYLLKCLETGWYKIGITTNSTKNRISQIGGNIKEVHHVVLEDPRKHESILHKRYAKDREYNLCVKGGPTEFFSITEQQAQEVIDYMNEVSSNA